MKNLHNALLLKKLQQLKELGYKYTDTKPFSYEEQNHLELPNELNELKKQAQNCHLCSLSKNRNKIIFGEGNKNADIMFVGGFPIEMEDDAGKIFLGRGGEMLTAMIEKVLGLQRKDVYISNLLKCHPLNTQELHETPFHTCKAYLFKEIELVKPKIIITLGKEAYHYLTNETSDLKDIRGEMTNHKNFRLMPTYHPNFLLKNPSLKKEVFIDLQRVKSLL